MEKKGIYIWGTGQYADDFCQKNEKLLKRLPIIGFIDNSPNKWDKKFYSWNIFNPNVLEKENDCGIYIAIYDSMPIVEQIKKDYPFYTTRILSNKNFLILDRYKDSNDQEIKEICTRLLCHPATFYNYDFCDSYSSEDYYIDNDDGMFYAIRNGKKLYFSSAVKDEKTAREVYRFLCLEQDKKSPHRYLDEKHVIRDGAIVIDAGAAEGFFSLDIIDNVKKIYIFEPEPGWYDALKKTFKPYSDKVVIIKKFLSNFENDEYTTLDKTVEEKEIDFIKMDIEGEEYYALEGGINLLRNSSKLSCAICTYHREHAYSAIKELLESTGYEVSHTNGYMLWHEEIKDCDNMSTLRRGLIRARKK